ncbi:MAG: thioesterase family protein [Geminicoccaceae bacterium]
MTTPEIGAEAEVLLTVSPADTAARLGVEAGEAYPEVLATRTMVGEMERAAAKLLRPHLKAGQLSVGVRVEVEHTAPTPVGARLVTRARYLGMEGKLHLFAVEAFDPGGRIGHGRHARAVVDEARLLAGADRRRD